jgi:HAD superfamily hydrolase (TIGR01549 family)
MKKYRGILFDLFATLALWHPDRLPQFTYKGKTVPSTLGELKFLIEQAVTEASFDEFYTAFTEVNEEHTDFRAKHLKEIPSRERFNSTLLRLGYPSSDATSAIAETLSLRHMELLASVAKIPPEYAPFLKRLSENYQLALVSNFDHHPTAHQILTRDGAHPHFEEILISDSHGWRKPHRRIFDDALLALSLSAEEVLFVGDSWEDDVVGAANAGIDVAWVNAKNKPRPNELHVPTFEINNIIELEDHLP